MPPLGMFYRQPSIGPERVITRPSVRARSQQLAARGTCSMRIDLFRLSIQFKTEMDRLSLSSY